MAPSIWLILKEQLTPKHSLIIVSVAALYLASSIYLLNIRLVINTLTGNFPIDYKARLMFFLLGGLWTNMRPIDFTLSIVISLLVGVNLFLLFRTFELFRHAKIKLAIGGGSILGITAASCASCGISIFSLLGLTATLSFIPFEGTAVKVTSLVLLLFSVFYVLRTIRNSIYCKI